MDCCGFLRVVIMTLLIKKWGWKMYGGFGGFSRILFLRLSEGLNNVIANNIYE